MNSVKKRATVLMVSGAVIGAVAVGVYFLQGSTMSPTTATSTPSIFDMEPIIPEAKVSTGGWKTCRNEEYGWEVQYPGEWHIYGEDALNDAPVKRSYVRESEECNGASVLLTQNNIHTAERGNIEFYIGVRQDNQTSNNYWETFLKLRSSGSYWIGGDVRPVLVDGSFSIERIGEGVSDEFS